MNIRKISVEKFKAGIKQWEARMFPALKIEIIKQDSDPVTPPNTPVTPDEEKNKIKNSKFY